jgi:Uma2 family endonuclease
MQNVQNITGHIPIQPPPPGRVDEILRLIEGLPGDSELILHGYSWDDYSELMDALIDPAGLRVAFDGSALQIMTLSSTHEKLALLLERMISLLSLRLGIDVEAFGSTTVKLSKEMKGLEPDACYYVQRAD